MRFMSAWSDLSAITSMRCGRFGVRCRNWRHSSMVASSAAAQRRVMLRADDGGAVAGAYYEPSRRPAPAIVLLHMLGRSHADWDSAAEDLADAGFAVLALDFRSGEDASSLLRDVRAGRRFCASDRKSCRAESASPAHRSARMSRCSMRLTIRAWRPLRCSLRASITGGCAPKAR